VARGNFTFRIIVGLPLNSSSYTEIGKRLGVKVVWTNMSETDIRHTTHKQCLHPLQQQQHIY